MSAALRWFRIAAVAEAVSWAGLLAGMLLKYVVSDNETGVHVFGPIHGGLFIVYLLAVTVAARMRGWPLSTWVLGVVSAVPPFMTAWFERRMAREAQRETSATADVS